MCFTLHIATTFDLPKLPWDEADRHVWVGDVPDYATAVRAHFSLPVVAYVGSDLNCGCGFRHLDFQNGGWPGDEEWVISEGLIDTAGTEKNHRELHAVLTDALRHSPVVELYGCWTDNYGEKTEGEQEIQPDDTLSERFFFRERVLYRLSGQSGHWRVSGTPCASSSLPTTTPSHGPARTSPWTSSSPAGTCTTR